MERFAGPILILLVYAVFRAFWRPVTVLEYQRCIKYVKGRYVCMLEAGRYWVYSPTTHTDIVDIRPRYESIPGQEVLSSDGVTVKLSLVAVYEVVDPSTAVNKVQDYGQALCLVVQTALRSVVGSSTIDELIESRRELGPKLMEAAGPLVGQLGLRLVSVDIKDIMLPGEVKKLFTQIIKARKEGQAALEKARAETAALRNLANVASLVETHPSLVQLRLLQHLSEQSGNTIMLNVPQQGTVVPVKSGVGVQSVVDEVAE